jgi:hypothetical protein
VGGRRSYAHMVQPWTLRRAEARAPDSLNSAGVVLCAPALCEGGPGAAANMLRPLMAAATRKAMPVRGSVVLSSAIGRRDSASAPRAHVVSILCVRCRAKVLARAKVLLCDERGRGKPARPTALAVQEGPPSPPARLGPIHGSGRAVRSRAHPLTGLATRARWTDLLPAPIRMAKLGATWLPSLAEQVERRRITCAGQTWRAHFRGLLPPRSHRSTGRGSRREGHMTARSRVPARPPNAQ